VDFHCTCRLIVLRMHGRHLRLMNGTCHQSFASWKQAGFSAPVPICWATRVEGVYSRADPVPLNSSLKVCKLLQSSSPCNDPHQSPMKLRVTMGTFPTQPCHRKTVI